MKISSIPRRGCFAFTLVELVAVIVVLAILSGVATVKYLDYSTKANEAAEAGVVAAVRTGLNTVRMMGALNNQGSQGTWPATLDSSSVNAGASAANPLFTAVMQEPVTSGWSKGTSSNRYLSPANNVYVYDTGNGTFQREVANGSGGTGTMPLASGPSYTSAAAWIAGSDPPTSMYGSGYTLSGTELNLDDSSASFTEAARRVTIGAQQTIQAGTYSVALDTKLTNYHNQLNYWMVVGIKNGTTVGLSGDTMRWDGTYPGAKTLFRDYAPESKSDGGWYGYSGTFTVSATDATTYDQIVVVMAGSKMAGQVLGWRNLSLTKQP